MAKMSPSAETRFLEGIAYIAERNPSAAEAIVRKMRSLRERLADFPRLGARGPIPGTRRMFINPLVLTVRETKDGAVIVAVRHAKQKDAYAPSEALEDHQQDEEDTSVLKP